MILSFKSQLTPFLAAVCISALFTSGCWNFEPSEGEDECGNGVREGPEECDTNVGGQTCVSLGLGYTGGILACDNSCDFDTSLCFTCGNGLCEVGAGESLVDCPADCG